MDPDKQRAQTGQHCSTQQAISQQDLTWLPEGRVLQLLLPWNEKMGL